MNFREKDFFKKRVNELKQKMQNVSSALIITHDFPDPDCIGAAFGLQQLLKSWSIDTRIAFGGFVGRAENRAMIRELNIQTIPLALIDYSDYDKILMVDSFPGSGHVSLPEDKKVDVVIDHHPNDIPSGSETFYEIIPQIGSTSTIITSYLDAENIKLKPAVATALFYGIKTDTNDMSVNVTEPDLKSYKILFDNMDHIALSNIEAPQRGLEYFKVLHRATEATQYFEKVGYTHLGEVSSPDFVAEIADLFHSYEKLEWMFSTAIFKNQLFFSVRSKKDSTAGKKAEKIATTLGGHGGGHSTKAAGQIPISEKMTSDKMVAEFYRKFLEMLKISNIKPIRLL